MISTFIVFKGIIIIDFYFTLRRILEIHKLCHCPYSSIYGVFQVKSILLKVDGYVSRNSIFM